MALLILGILFWVIGFAMIIWYKRRKHNRSIRQAENGYSDPVLKSFFDTALKSAGITSVLMGCVMVGSQEYTDSRWLGVVLLVIVIMLVYQLPMKSKK